MIEQLRPLAMGRGPCAGHKFYSALALLLTINGVAIGLALVLAWLAALMPRVKWQKGTALTLVTPIRTHSECDPKTPRSRRLS